MESYSGNIGKDAWVKVATDEDYILQCKSSSGKLLVKVSSTEPTSVSGALELSGGDFITSTILPGKVWVKALSETILIAYAK